MSTDRDWRPKGATVRVEYDLFDLPGPLLIKGFRRDKQDGELLSWQPADSNIRPDVLIRAFLVGNGTALLSYGFKRISLSGIEYFIETGLPVVREPERREQLPKYLGTDEAVGKLSSLFSELKFKDPKVSISVAIREESAATYHEDNRVNQSIIISVAHQSFGEKAICRVAATWYNDEDGRVPESYSYAFEPLEIFEEVKRKLIGEELIY